VREKSIQGQPLQSPTMAVPATVLYHLAPRGASTGDVESLFSHLLSLCHAHHLSPRQVVDRVLPEVERRIDTTIYTPRYQIGWGWDKHAGLDLVGMHRSAERWVRVMEAATGLKGLRGATLLPLQEFTTGNLITDEERVCTDCLDSDMTDGGLPYGRLLWRMRPVNCCPIHRKRLIVPTCGHSPRDSKPEYERIRFSGVCSKCCSIGHRCRRNQADAATDAEVWRAEQCRQVLAASSAIETAGPETMRVALREYCAPRGTACSLAYRSGMHKSVLSEWMRTPGTRMSLDQLLDICAADGLELAELMQGRVEHPAGAGGLAPTRERRQAKRVDHDAVRQALIGALAEGLSLTEVARAQRVDLKTLTRHRELYVQVRAAAAARRAQEEEARHLAAIDKVEGMARELAKRGRRLTPRNAQGLGVGGIMPSSAEAAVFSLMRFGLGDRSARLSASATRLGHRFILRINESIVRLRAEIEGDQLQLALSPD
jgi:hypothetical protein